MRFVCAVLLLDHTLSKRYHTIELKGYLGVAPFLGGAVYLALIFAQRSFSSQFTPAYITGAAVVFGPIAALYFFA